MTRVTGPRELAKVARTLNPTVSGARSSILGGHASKSASMMAREELQKRTDTASMHTISRPTPIHPPTASSFHTTPSRPMRSDTSTIDFAHLPPAHTLYSTTSPDYIHYPILPDNFHSASANANSLSEDIVRAVEIEDGPVKKAEISVVAVNPDAVLHASAMTEVEGMGVDGVELGFVHDLFNDGSKKVADGESQGIVRDLWKGLMDDIFAAKAKPAM